eukprot:m.87082 g.87082  ORF g.87082 m.87082 type:complete len:56 (+) comp13577_c0_seq4:172-339(+)
MHTHTKLRLNLALRSLTTNTVAGFFLQKQWRAFNQYRADRAKAQYLLAKQRLDEA